MADCLLLKGGGGVNGSDDCTATQEHVLKGKTAIVNGSDDNPVDGTIENRGAWAGSVAMNSKVTVPEGYHNGNGSVSGPAITDNGAVRKQLDINESYTIPKGYHNGNGKVEQNIATKAAAAYNTSTADQTIAASQFLTGAQTIRAVKTQNIDAANIIAGVSVKVGDSGDAGRIKNVVGSRPYRIKTISAEADCSSVRDTEPESMSFTMPSDGMVYYGGLFCCFSYANVGRCEIYKNEVLVDSRNYRGGAIDLRTSMFDQSFTAKAGDVISVYADTNGGNAVACIQAVILY